MSKSFKQVTEQENILMVVDALNLAFRWKHSGATDFQEDYIRTVDSLRKSYKAKWVIIAADQGSSSYRKAIFPDYKQNRKDKFAEQTDAEKAAFEMFFEDYQKTLDQLRNQTTYPVIQFDKTEADDIAAYIAKFVNSSSIVDHCWLISSDRDWDLLISEKVSRFSYVTRKEITANNWTSHYDFTKDEYISIKCLTGDTGDNVPGVPGIGPKRALQLVQEYGTALDIVAQLPINSKLKYIQALNQSGDQIMLNYQLMDLETFCQDALGDNTKQMDQILENYINE
ncbi:MAG: 5'-3' exonuclease H3TH domain-containing protein [Burkholderiales bacterium]